LKTEKISYSEGVTIPTGVKFESRKILISAEASLGSEDQGEFKARCMDRLRDFVKAELKKAK